MKAGESVFNHRIFATIALALPAVGFFVGCDVRPAGSLEDGMRALTESLGVSLPDDARLVLYSGTRDGRQPVWVIRHTNSLTFSANADESTCPVSSVAGILVDLRADPQMTGSIEGDTGRFVRWHRGKWEFRSREVRTDLGLLSIIERFPTESS